MVGVHPRDRGAGPGSGHRLLVRGIVKDAVDHEAVVGVDVGGQHRLRRRDDVEVDADPLSAT